MVNLEYRGKVRGMNPESSWEAASRQTNEKVDRVKVVIVSLLKSFGPMTDEAIVDRYDGSTWLDPEIPKVTPQSIRTRRKALNVEGVVRDTGRRGHTRTGNTATIWAVANE